MLQVQLQDAFKAEADTVIDHLKDELKKAGIEYADINHSDPQSLKDADSIQINVLGVPSTKAGNFRQIVNDSYNGAWNLTTVNSDRLPDDHANQRGVEAVSRMRSRRASTPLRRRSTAWAWPNPPCSRAAAAKPKRRSWCSFPAWTIRHASNKF